MVAMAVLLVAVISGCGAKAAPTTAAAATGDDIVFGEGEVPATIPDGFPLPTGSVVGSTMVVAESGLTEFVVRDAIEQSTMVEFFDVNLPNAGLAVDASGADGDGWRIEFSDGAAKGTIDITTAAPAVSQAVIRFNVQ